jgi:hypothetical protein
MTASFAGEGWIPSAGMYCGGEERAMMRTGKAEADAAGVRVCQTVNKLDVPSAETRARVSFMMSARTIADAVQTLGYKGAV